MTASFAAASGDGARVLHHDREPGRRRHQRRERRLRLDRRVAGARHLGNLHPGSRAAARASTRRPPTAARSSSRTTEKLGAGDTDSQRRHLRGGGSRLGADPGLRRRRRLPARLRQRRREPAILNAATRRRLARRSSRPPKRSRPQDTDAGDDIYLRNLGAARRASPARPASARTRGPATRSSRAPRATAPTSSSRPTSASPPRTSTPSPTSTSAPNGETRIVSTGNSATIGPATPVLDRHRSRLARGIARPRRSRARRIRVLDQDLHQRRLLRRAGRHRHRRRTRLAPGSRSPSRPARRPASGPRRRRRRRHLALLARRQLHPGDPRSRRLRRRRRPRNRRLLGRRKLRRRQDRIRDQDRRRQQGGGRVDRLRRAADADHLRPRLEDAQAAARLPLHRRDRTAGHRLLLQGRPPRAGRLRLAAEAEAAGARQARLPGQGGQRGRSLGPSPVKRKFKVVAMRRALARRLRGRVGEAGMTLIELLVGAAMGVIVIGGHRVDDDQRRQEPAADQREGADDLDRALGAGADDAGDPQRHRGRPRKSDRLGSLLHRVRAGRRPAAGPARWPAARKAIQCQVTYSCTTTTCSRIEADPGVYTRHRTTIVTGIDSAERASATRRAPTTPPGTSKSRCSFPTRAAAAT